MSLHIPMPREGHLQQVYHIFGYLSQHNNSKLVFDPTYPVVDKDGFEVQYWRHVYGIVSEGILPNAPKDPDNGILMKA